jgi:hypothetical protein
MFIVGDFPEHIGQNELIRTQICTQGSRTNPLGLQESSHHFGFRFKY